jgi:hypothetical protein
MRKKILQQESQTAPSMQQSWLDLDQLARVEVTSEEEAYPIEAALRDTAGNEDGWRAARPGEQTIRLVFDAPQKIGRIRVLFLERERERTQEFLLRWQPAGSPSYREIVRQQYNFSPQQSTAELEDYTVELHGVRALELCITPDIGGGSVCASLAQLRLG